MVRFAWARVVAVVGAGGVGGLHILTLARLGVGKFNIADPDTFEPVNVSRQFGAANSTYGRNKAQVLAEIVKDINPQAEVTTFVEGVVEQNLDEFLGDSKVLIDGIDFFEFAIRRKIFVAAREKGIYAVTCAPLGFGSTLQTFSPHGMDFDTYFGTKENYSYERNLAAFAAGLAPNPYHVSYLDDAGLTYTKPQGAYYVMVDCSEFGVTDDNDFCRWLAREVGVAAVPGSSFFHEPVNHLIRLHFSRSEEILTETGQRLKRIRSLV